MLQKFGNKAKGYWEKIETHNRKKENICHAEDLLQAIDLRIANDTLENIPFYKQFFITWSSQYGCWSCQSLV
jgi:hypothetical protein